MLRRRKLERVEADLARGVLEHLFPRGGLHHPRTTVRRGTAGVGVDRGAVPAEVGNPVRAGEQHPDQRAGRTAGHGEGARVVEVLHVGGHDQPVVVDCQRDVALLLACMGGRDEVLAPVFAPLDRRAELVRGDCDHDLLAADERLEAEPATDVADLHPDLVLGHAGGAGECQPRLVGVLARHPHVEPLVERLPVRHDAAALHRDHRVAVLHEALRHDVRRRTRSRRDRRRSSARPSASRRSRDDSGGRRCRRRPGQCRSP